MEEEKKKNELLVEAEWEQNEIGRKKTGEDESRKK